jgi:hypothetical protein
MDPMKRCEAGYLAGKLRGEVAVPRCHVVEGDSDVRRDTCGRLVEIGAYLFSIDRPRRLIYLKLPACGRTFEPERGGDAAQRPTPRRRDEG